MALALTYGGEPQGGPEFGEARGLVAAFLVALALHGGALAVLTLWRSTAVVAPPGELEITIDLAPQMVEVESVAPVETSVPAGAPAQIVPVEPVEAVTVQPAEPQPSVEARPVESAALPPPIESDAPPPPVVPAQVAPPAETPPPPLLAEALPPPDAAPIESTAIEALPVPPAMTPPPEPETVTPPPVETVTARPLPEPKPVQPKPVERRPIERKPVPKREPVQRERPRPVRQAAPPGASGQSQRDAARGASSRENTGGAAASAADPSVMSRYAAQLAAALKARLRYPDAARTAGVTGSATLRFTLHRSGRVLSASITRSAGHPALDQAALATAVPGSTLPPAPDGVPQQQMTISVPLRFDMR